MSRIDASGSTYSGPRICLLVLLVCFSLSACGFRLAGTTELPPQLASIYLVTSDFSDSQRKLLQRSLSGAGASLVEQPDSQSVQLNVSLTTFPDRQMATSAISGEIVKRISRSLSFNVKAADGEVLLEAKTVRQQKDVNLNNDNLLSSDRELEAVTRDLEQTLFEQLIRQLTLI